jgi:hypothetical protein
MMGTAIKTVEKKAIGLRASTEVLEKAGAALPMRYPRSGHSCVK